MDVAYYISDLLGQQGELSVPNLGYFVQIRMNAYYDEQEKKFFPPHYSVQFDPQVIDDDDTLANYITELKNISLASAKYFIEKYISNLKDSVIVEDVPFAGLGAFSSDGVKLTFKSNPKTNYPDFFAYIPLEAYKIGETPVIKPAGQPADDTDQLAANTAQPVPNAEQPAANSYETDTDPLIKPEPPVVALPLNPDGSPADIFEDEPRRGLGALTIVLIVLTVMAIALAGLYKFRPGMFGWYFTLHKDPYVLNRPPAKPVRKDTLAVQMPIVKSDSVKTDSAAKTDTPGITVKTTTGKKPLGVAKETIPADAMAANNATGTPAGTKPGVAKTTTAKPVISKKTAVPVITAPVITNPPVTSSTAMPDIVPKGWWVIYAGATPIRHDVDRMIVNYKSRGFTQARLLTTKIGPGGNYKIILGAFQTHTEANDAKKEMLVTGKLKNTDLSVERLPK